MENNETYQKAKERVEIKIIFYLHLGIYIVVNVLLIILNLFTLPEYLWFKWPLLGWAIGIFFHGLNVFVATKGESIKERMIQKELLKESERRKD